jgi:hypothetical protein
MTNPQHADIQQALILIAPKVLRLDCWRLDPVDESRLQTLGHLAGVLACATSLAYPEQAREAWTGACHGALSEASRDIKSRALDDGQNASSNPDHSLTAQHNMHLARGMRLVASPDELGFVIDAISTAPTASSVSTGGLKPPADDWETLVERSQKHLENLRRAQKEHPRNRLLNDALSQSNEYQAQFKISTLDGSQPASFWERDEERVRRAQNAFIGKIPSSETLQAVAAGAAEAATRAVLRRSPEARSLFDGAMAALEAGLREPRFAHATALSISAFAPCWLGLLKSDHDSAPLAHQALRLALLREDIVPMGQNFKEAWALAHLGAAPSPQDLTAFEAMARCKLPPSLGDRIDERAPELAAPLALVEIGKALNKAPTDVDMPRLIRALSAIPDPQDLQNSADVERQRNLREACEEGLARWGRSLTSAGHAGQWAQINQALINSPAAQWAQAPQENLQEDIERRRPLDAIAHALCGGGVPGDPALVSALINSLWAARSELNSQFERQEISQALPAASHASRPRL